MFEKISSRIRYPEWVRLDPRFKRLDLLDKLLDGTFYDHLRNAFYDETDMRGVQIPIEERRPSAQYRLPQWLAHWAARKLFAGRHVPHLRHPDKSTEKFVRGLVKRMNFWNRMMEACVLGSVGSVAVTFRIKGPVVTLFIWRAKHCQPHFNENGELDSLRVAYLTTGIQLMTMRMPGRYVPGDLYWYIRDFTAIGEITYLAEKKDDWNPVTGFDGKRNVDQTPRMLMPWPGEEYAHDLKSVSAVWIKNLAGGTAPDGLCGWEIAIPNSIDIDYTLSQAGRGVRYNSAPQLVVKGELLSDDEFEVDTNSPTSQRSVTRSPSTVLHLAPDIRDQDGNVTGGGDAKLLEMTGTGADAAMKYIDHLRDLSLEMMQAARKNPEKMHAPLSGRAMEYLDEDSHDFIMELRSHWGENGVLHLMRKILDALKVKEPHKLNCHWPRMYQPTPADIQQLVAAFAQAINPLEVVYNGRISARPANGQSGQGARSAPGSPGAAARPGPNTPPPEEFMLLTPQEARAYLLLNLDIPLLDLEGPDADQDEGMPDDGSQGSQVKTVDEPGGDVPRPSATDLGYDAPRGQESHIGSEVTINA